MMPVAMPTLALLDHGVRADMDAERRQTTARPEEDLRAGRVATARFYRIGV